MTVPVVGDAVGMTVVLGKGVGVGVTVIVPVVGDAVGTTVVLGERVSVGVSVRVDVVNDAVGVTVGLGGVGDGVASGSFMTETTYKTYIGSLLLHGIRSQKKPKK